MANSHDPHRPFYGDDPAEWYSETHPPALPPSRTFHPEDVVTPKFLADIPEVRLEIAKRTRLFSYRVLEEFYDFENDPDALDNLVHEPRIAYEVQKLRNALELWMAEVDDPALDAFVNRASRQALDDLMAHPAETIGRREET